MKKLFFILLLTACSNPSPLEQMQPPLIIIRNDSITVVEDAEGRQYELTLSERTYFGTNFMNLKDTLK